MKYLKTFEELSPETYKSAADKLVARGETERAQNITQYIESEYFKNFIDKMRTDPSFKKLVEEIILINLLENNFFDKFFSIL